MRTTFKILLWVCGIATFCALLSWAGDFDKSDCEVTLAKKLNTSAVYYRGHCLVKGYGRVDGR